MKNKKHQYRKDGLKRLALSILLLTMLTLTACESLPFDLDLPWALPTSVVPESTEEPEQDLTPSPENETELTETPALPPSKLILWLPPAFDPNNESEAGTILQEKLNLFAYENKIEIIVRVKSQTGAGSLTDALTAAKAAVPEVLPDLIALSAPELQLAAERDLIYPHEALTQLLDENDWYPFGHQLSEADDLIVAVPAIGDSLSLVYDSVYPFIPSDDWTNVKGNYGYFAFAADDPQGKFLLLLYMAVGGEVMDGQGYALLQEEPLIEALQILKDGRNARHISSLSLGFQNESQPWQSFLDRALNTAVVPVSLVLTGLDESKDQPDPALTQPDFSLGTGSAWALGSPDPARQELALKLLSQLSETEFLARWSEAMGKLPARPSALGYWTHPTLKPALEVIAQNVELYPPEDILNKLGPILRNATLLILRDNASVSETARLAVESVK
ncbi:MAG TPA: hypothetical protein GX730_00595 [Chloroflexi bacterium]|nr:hypothetical protein [Chloroflexota bacterium]